MKMLATSAIFASLFLSMQVEASNSLLSDARQAWFTQVGSTMRDEVTAIDLGMPGVLIGVGGTEGEYPGPQVGSYDIFVNWVDTRTGRVSVSSQFGTPYSEHPFDVASDGAGGAYIVGETLGLMPNTINSQVHSGLEDAFLTHVDDTGDVVWSRQIAGTAFDRATSVEVNSMGHVVVAGYTKSAIGAESFGDFDGFVASFDSDGNQLWSEQFGTIGGDVLLGLAIDPNDDIYVAGSTDRELAGTNIGDDDVFIRKMRSDGAVEWTAQFGTSENEQPTAISLDSQGNPIVAGVTWGALARSRAGSADAFVVKYSSAGEFVWSNQIGSLVDDVAYAVAVTDDDRVYLAGTSWGQIAEPVLPLDPDDAAGSGGGDAFLVELHPNGMESASEQYGTPYFDTFSSIEAEGGDIYLGGRFLSNNRIGEASGFILKIRSIPEPSSLLLILGGVGGMMAWRRRG